MNGRVIGVAASLAAALPAQVEWQVEDPRTRAVVVVERSVQVPPKAVVRTPAGRAHAHFPFDADGKPFSMSFDVADGERVVLEPGTSQQVDLVAIR